MMDPNSMEEPATRPGVGPMANGGRLIVASVRLPVMLSRRQEAWEVKPSPGGLVTALRAVAQRRDFTWLGWPGTNVPEADRAAVARVLSRHGSVPVYLSKAEIEGFYEGFSNRVLWPLFHGLPSRVHFSAAAWKTYERVNEMFAEAIAAQADPTDLIWIHDYQLALVPEFLRRSGVNAPIGFFLHIPFPSAENYRTLPVRDEILRGILGADFIAFHAYEYVSHFRSACLRLLGIESEPDVVRLPARRVHVGALPIGIDPGEISQLVRGDDAAEEYASVCRTYAGKKIIVGVDRLDYTKGIPEKLLAFEELLRQYPKWRTHAVLIQVAAPSREAVDEYRQLKRQVDELVGRINGRYGSASNMPIVYVNQSVPRSRLVGLYRAADVALITPIRDGMNLVALEYVAARGDLGGTLILSEFAGAAHLLAGAKLVSPYNVVQVAETLAEALETDADPSTFSHMLEFINQNTSLVWANRFLDRLELLFHDRRPKIVRLRVNAPDVVSKLHAAKKPLVLLDYDGTLRKFEMQPADATPTGRIKHVLDALSRVARVYLVSGRPAEVLDSWFGKLHVGLVAEHGFAIKDPDGEWQERAAMTGGAVWRKVEQLMKEFVTRTPGSRIERKKVSIAWHYRAADPEWGTLQANELFSLLEDAVRRHGYSVLRGSCVLEVRPRTMTKGHSTIELLKRNSAADALFCAGDDRTDEEMMEAIPKAWRSRTVTCWVGGRNAIADFWVDSADELLEQLEALAKAWETTVIHRERPRKRSVR